MDKLKKQILKNRIGESRDRLYRVALAWSGDKMLADDLVQDTITIGIVNSHQLRDESRLFVWLYSILNNSWRKYLRNKKLQIEFDDQLMADEDCAGPFRTCEVTEMASRVRAAVTTLPQNQSQVIALVDLEELSYCEVSEVLDIPVGTVMSRLHRARKSLLMKLSTSAITPATTETEVGKIHRRKVNKDNIRVVK